MALTSKIFSNLRGPRGFSASLKGASGSSISVRITPSMTSSAFGGHQRVEGLCLHDRYRCSVERPRQTEFVNTVGHLARGGEQQRRRSADKDAVTVSQCAAPSCSDARCWVGTSVNSRSDRPLLSCRDRWSAGYKSHPPDQEPPDVGSDKGAGSIPASRPGAGRSNAGSPSSGAGRRSPCRAHRRPRQPPEAQMIGLRFRPALPDRIRFDAKGRRTDRASTERPVRLTHRKLDPAGP